MITRIALAAIIAAVAATTVVAQSDPIAARRGMMKGIGSANASITQMLDGKQPFDATKARAALETIADNSSKIVALFPATSKEGDTNALPVVWDNKADFDSRMAKMGADAKAAASKVTDLDSLKTGIGAVRQNCGGCHNTYRKKS